MRAFWKQLSPHNLLHKIAGAAFVLLASPAAAHAAGPLCKSLVDSRIAIAVNIINCISSLFGNAVTSVAQALSTYMKPVATEMFLLAIIIFGLKILGRGGGWADALGFVTRMAVVSLFLAGLGDFSGYMFQMQSELVNGVGGGNPWGQIDSFMGKMLGYGANFTVATGLVGILAAAMMSSAFGVALFFFGIKALLDLVFFVIQAMFVHLTAVIVLAFMIAISPLVIPLGIFKYTEKYLLSWARIVVATIITPVFVVMALHAFIAPVDTSVKRIFTSLGVSTGKPNFSAFFRAQESSYAWLTPSDANANKEIQQATGAALQDPSIPANLNPSMRYGLNTSPFDSNGINFGLNSIQIVKDLMVEFAKLIIITFLAKSLVDQMPNVAAGIAGGGHGIFKMEETAIERTLKAQVSKAEESAKDAIGKRGGG